MFRHLLPALLLAGLSAMASAAPTPVPRIIGGSDAAGGEFPFMAALVRSASVNAFYANDYQAQFCGGTVIAARWVLTAAHCVEGLLNDQFQVIAGVTSLPTAAPFATRIAVQGVVQHPLYNEDKISNDLALIHLATPVATAAGFSLDPGTRVATLRDGDDLTAIGWGLVSQGVLSTSGDDTSSPTLQKATLDFFSFARCNALYDGYLHASALCAGYMSGPPRDACFGDSGGPLLLPLGGGNWQQLGVVSYGTSVCAQADSPGVFVNIGQYSAFIADSQTKPDLRVSFGTVGGSEVGIRTRSFALVHNVSPANPSTGTVLLITLSGDLMISNAASLGGCSISSTGAGTSMVTTVNCTLGTLAPGASSSREMALELYGDGPFSASATATSANGDSFVPNNTATRTYQLQLNAQPKTLDNTGPASLWMLLSLLLLARRHAPNHSLRLRQFLRLG